MYAACNGTAACSDGQIFFKPTRKKMLKGLKWTKAEVKCTRKQLKRNSTFRCKKNEH